MSRVHFDSCHCFVLILLHVHLFHQLIFILQKPNLAPDVKDKEYKPHDIPQRQSVQHSESCAPARRAKRTKAEVSNMERHTGSSFCMQAEWQL